MTIKNSSETIVYKLVGMIRQPAYLRPVCGFYYLEVLLTIEKKTPTKPCQYYNKIRKEFRYVCGYSDSIYINPCFTLYLNDSQIKVFNVLENEGKYFLSENTY